MKRDGSSAAKTISRGPVKPFDSARSHDSYYGIRLMITVVRINGDGAR